ncbi:cystathionine beta-synthase [Aeropyrum pernix K1]|uniref:Cystathionine beta-synthase n=1 Tax=Aeropyrum pernix (strain ATCC 700893 / DSM 11879 / JCM 9820 / NBRC 100138 / K1) TaxID=272557 RepID=Q9YCN5_AERPE|nr:PLP-dependent cysteine synthase family protein [Aeropyrum pernix]BAA80212.2 cystathionine beta-synthase [Aeropyrum pernix K1]
MRKGLGSGVYGSILDLVGGTPLLRLGRVERFFRLEGVELYGKLEMFNPGGSVKDRIGLYMLMDARSRGLVEEGAVIIEPTAGNTGVGLALAAIHYGFRLVAVMPSKMSVEKELILRAYGAYVIRTPTAVPPESPLSYYRVAEAVRNLLWMIGGRPGGGEVRKVVEKVQTLVREERVEDLRSILEASVEPTPYAYIPNQYSNPANPRAHEETTGREIWMQTGGRVDVVYAGMGTRGTITGVARYLKRAKPSVRIVGVDPEGSIYSLVKKGMSPHEAAKHARPYKVEGIGEDFIPSTIDLSLVDEVVVVTDQQAFSMARMLARLEGVLAGGSSGAALYAAVKHIKTRRVRGVAVVILPDTGRNYINKLYNDRWMGENGFSTRDEEVLGELL